MKKIDDVELISVKDMSFAFETENIIDRADFVINRGDVITIVGRTAEARLPFFVF